MFVNEEQQEVAKESTGFVNYMGIAPRIILAVNPTKKELGIIYGREIEGDEPSYVKDVEVEDKVVRRVSLKFMGKTIYSIAHPTDEIDVILNNTFILEKAYNTSEAKGTFQVIDDFGQSCWVTKEQYQNKQVPQYSNGPAKIDTATWRPAYKGEVDLVNFLRVLFNITDLQVWSSTAGYVDNPKLKDPEALKKCAFWKKEDTEKLLKGDFKELKAAVAKVPNNIVINYFYTETNSDNRVFMKMLPDVTLKPHFSMNSCIKTFTKRLITDKNSMKNYYETSNPDKLKGMSINYIDKLVKVEVKPTEYKENNSMYVHAETVEDLPEDNVSELPF
jgi:hypothetical protein